MSHHTPFPNQTFNSHSVGSYLSDYAASLAHVFATLDTGALEQIKTAVQQASTKGRRVYAIGNGGSAAVADHLSCDLTKGCDHSGHPPIRVHPLASSLSLYTALANDCGFDKVFSRQLAYYADPGDVLIAISSSGESANILAAVDAAKARDVLTIGIAGFAGGRLVRAADIGLHLDAMNYGVVEDATQSVMHILAQVIAAERSGPG